MQRNDLLSRIRASLARDRDLGAWDIMRKGVSYGTALLSAPLFLRDIDNVGSRPRARGKPIIENLGRIDIGNDFQVSCAFAPVEIATGRDAVVTIGHDVDLNFGVTICAKSSIKIGNRVGMGPYVRVIDHDEDGSDQIEIGDGVWLAARVRVEKGVKIGARTVVTAGSVVRTSLPPDVVAGGNPARPLRSRDGSKRAPVVREEPAFDHHALIVADFTINEIASYLRTSELGPAVGATIAPFDQVVQTLLQARELAKGHDTLFVWARPERAVPSFGERMRGMCTDIQSILSEVDAFADLVLRASESFRFVLVASFTIPPHLRGLGMLDLHEEGLGHAFMRMNLRLAERLRSAPNVGLLDASRWLLGPSSFRPKLWYMGKIGWSNDVLRAAAEDVRSALRGFAGRSKKLIVVDLDDTLWGGVVGDVGWESLRLGGHDPIGEAFVDFQRELKTLARRGVALAIVSKNEESVALEAIEKHQAMVLRKEDFAGWRINWRDKAQNIAEIATELKLLPQSIVFIDDNPIERARVREALPDVFVPEWPEEKTEYALALQTLKCFDTPRLSREDIERTRMYADERARSELRMTVSSIDEWLENLQTRARFVRLSPDNLARSAQLLNKTNQMNARTRRLSEVELRTWADDPNREVWAVYVSDRLGDAGLTGLLSLELDGRTMNVVDFVLSCRVMGRRVEDALLSFACTRASSRGAASLHVPFFETAKNKPCRTFLETSKLELAHDETPYIVYVCDPPEYAKPKGITLEVE